MLNKILVAVFQARDLSGQKRIGEKVQYNGSVYLCNFKEFFWKLNWSYIVLKKIDFEDQKKNDQNNNAFNLLISNCPTNKLNTVEKEIKDACQKKIVKNYETDPLPGISKLFNGKTFKHEIITIYSKKIIYIF